MMSNETWVWTPENKKKAVEEGWVCCPSYFDCWMDPPPYERGACCECMGDSSVCAGCKPSRIIRDKMCEELGLEAKSWKDISKELGEKTVKELWEINSILSPRVHNIKNTDKEFHVYNWLNHTVGYHLHERGQI